MRRSGRARLTAALRAQRPALGHRPRRRGLRVVAAEDGVVTLAADGSPGAVLPLLGRDRGADPRRRARRHRRQAGLGRPGAAAGGPAAGDLAEAARAVLDAEINPAIAAHRGRVTVVERGSDGWIRVRLEGGCQGCSLAEVTLRQGIEPVLRARLPAHDRARRRHRPRGGHRAVLLPGENGDRHGRAARAAAWSPRSTYRAADFILAAGRMGLDLRRRQRRRAAARRPYRHPGPFGRPRCQRPPDPGPAGPVDAVVAADTPMLVLAATVAAADGPAAQPGRRGARRHRQGGPAAAVGRGRCPSRRFRLVSAPGTPSGRRRRQSASQCVVKAVSLSASQGVLRADDPAAAVQAARRIRQVLDDAERSADEPLLIEEYLPGP